MVLLPRKVEEVLVAVPNSLYDAVVASLAEEGVLHVDRPPNIRGAAGEAKYRILYTRVSEKTAKLESFYTLLGVEPETVKGVTIEAGSWEEAYERAVEEYRGLEDEFDRRAARIAEIDAKTAELQTVKAVLEGVKHVEADVRRAQQASFLGYLLAYYNYKEPSQLEKLKKDITKLGLTGAIEEVGEEQAVIAVTGPRDAVHKLVQAHRRNLTPVTIPSDLPGSPRNAYAAIQSMLSELAREEKEILERLRKRLGELARYYTIMRALRYASKLLANTVRTRTTSFFRGFVDRKERGKLVKALERATGGAFLLKILAVKKAAEKVKPPTKVELPSILRPFHEVVRMYGEPDPDEIVPTLFLALTLPVIFGLMFPDAGHGLLLMLFALYMIRKGSPWRFLLTLLGAVSVVTGILAGEFFGPVVSSKIGLYQFWRSLGFTVPPLAQPTIAVEEMFRNVVSSRALLFRMVSISLWIGAYMLTLGALLGVVDAWLKKDREGLLASKLPAFIFFFSATLPFLIIPDAGRAGGIIKQALLGAGHGGVLQAIVFYGIVIGFLWRLLGEPILHALEGHNPLKAFGSSFMEAYEMLVMVLGNVPSFLRILGLALAHAGLMLGFAELYYLMAGHGIGGLLAGIAVYIFGNLLVAGLEAIIAFAHSLRLHFYEWFSKFYSGTGIVFEPLKLEGVRIQIRSITL